MDRLGASFRDEDELPVVKSLMEVGAEEERVVGIVSRVSREGLGTRGVHLVRSKLGVFLLRDEVRDFVAEDGRRDAARLVAGVDGVAWTRG